MRGLRDLLAGMAPEAALAARGDPPVTGLTDDSRQVCMGGIFVALRGTAVDGRRFVDDALDRGALAVVGEDLPPSGRALIVNVDDGRAALATLAWRWHGLEDAWKRTRLVGITGTNGKTTTALLTRAILRTAGIKCGLLGTVEYDLVGRTVSAGMTTPGPLKLAEYLRECVDNNAAAIVIETSSHALDQRRVAGLNFAAAAFTNLSGDHLDYHGTLEQYGDAKARLFAGLDDNAVAIVNRDDPWHERMIRDCRGRVVTYSLRGEADIRAEIAGATIDGTRFRLLMAGRDVEVENSVAGRHNVYNALAAAGLAQSLGVGVDGIVAGLRSVRSVPGRLQRVECAGPADVFVDYAHSDDALDNVLRALRPLTRGRLIVVFGCGGERDRSKRARMARVAARLADGIVVTSDNPRGEDPGAIIAEVLAGFTVSDRRRVRVEPDRMPAIRVALAEAGAGDVVLVAGKGHETCQVVGGHRMRFDDVEVVTRVAAELYGVETSSS